MKALLKKQKEHVARNVPQGMTAEREISRRR